MRRSLFTLTVLACVSMVALASLTFFSSAANGTRVADFTPTVFVHLPLVIKQPTPTPTPTPTPIPQCKLYVENNTGGELCYEVYGTGIGRKCCSAGTHYYGTFLPGTYSWHATARCGSASGTRYYSSGPWIHEFWCTGSAALKSAPLLLQAEE